jgi:hypothetical protein
VLIVRGQYRNALFILAAILSSATLCLDARAEPSPIGGVASYEGAPGDFIALTIDLDDGHHIEILRDPMTIIGRQIFSTLGRPAVDPDAGPQESLNFEYCDAKAKSCRPFYGEVLIQSITEHVVKGLVTMPNSIGDEVAFAAHVVQSENPLLTGGLFTHHVPGEKVYAFNHIHVTTKVDTSVSYVARKSRYSAKP